MARYKRAKYDDLEIENPNPEDLEEKTDPHSMEIVVDRIEHGLIGALRIVDKINKPFFIPGDIVHLRIPARLQKGDFILYKVEEEYFLRRIIKFENEDIFIAGDAEREYHKIRKEDVVAKAIARERKTKWLTISGFVKKKKFYVFRKVSLAKLRLGNRVTTYDQDINNEAFEAAMQNMEQQAAEQKKQFVINIDLDSDLSSFLNPDELAREWLAEEQPEAVEEEYEEDDIQYVDENGNPLTAEEIEALKAEQSEFEVTSNEASEVTDLASEEEDIDESTEDAAEEAVEESNEAEAIEASEEESSESSDDTEKTEAE